LKKASAGSLTEPSDAYTLAIIKYPESKNQESNYPVSRIKHPVLTYHPPSLLFHHHLETIYPALFRRVTPPAFRRERLTTPDDDFLDLDWYEQHNHRLVVISHGLEGNSQRPYILGMVRQALANGFDVLAWNFRGCSGEINRQLRFYHSGATDDLRLVVAHAAARYTQINLIGFSLGGNLTLKFLGEPDLLSAVKKAVAFSVPLHLSSSCDAISQPVNWLYAQRFLRHLKAKVMAKAKQFPQLDTAKLKTIQTLRDFDDHYTGPVHGFAGAEDYYTRCSAIGFLANIPVPTLLVNARNDSFLSPQCFPDVANPGITTEYPLRGGHCGFVQFNRNGVYWSEERALQFLST
jgi:predicted alpha/beta-fold hydrolase